MQLLLYNIGVTFYHMAIRLAAPFNAKALQWLRGRMGIFTYLTKKIGENDRIIWFHASSLGEFEQGRPVMEKIKQEKPGHKILLTFFSPSGYEIRKDYAGADLVCYLPREGKRNARRFLKLAKPEAAYFVKYDFWYHYLHELYKRHVPTFLISAIFRPGQPFFRWYGRMHRRMLGYFSHIFVQDVNSRHLLESIHITKVDVAGDTRFDRVYQIAQKREEHLHPENFASGGKVIIGGSLWPPDEDLLLELINHCQGQGLKFIVAPHEIREEHLKRFEERIQGREHLRYSQLGRDKKTDADIILIDNIGMLSSLYGHAHIALIGGGFGSGIHNVLEAAVYGIPVLFGPRYGKFREAVELAHTGGAIPVSGKEGFREAILPLIEDKGHYIQTAKKAREYVENNLGATEKIVQKSQVLIH